MFAPMTPTTERIRIQNENAELNRYAAATQPSNLGAMLLHGASCRASEDPAQRSSRTAGSGCPARQRKRLRLGSPTTT